MPQTRATGAEAARFGHEAATLIGEKIGAKKLRPDANFFEWNGHHVTIRTARHGNKQVGVLYAETLRNRWLQGQSYSTGSLLSRVQSGEALNEGAVTFAPACPRDAALRDLWWPHCRRGELLLLLPEQVRDNFNPRPDQAHRSSENGVTPDIVEIGKVYETKCNQNPSGHRDHVYSLCNSEVEICSISFVASASAMAESVHWCCAAVSLVVASCRIISQSFSVCSVFPW